MSEDILKLKRGITARVAAYTPAQGEPVMDVTLKQLRLGDGTTPGGIGVAPTASPALTGVPTAPTAAPGTNTTQVATTAFVDAARVILVAADALKAPLASPALTGVPLSVTPAVGTNTTQIATAAMVQAEVANKRAWTTYTPVVTAVSGTYTAASATGKYMVAFGICHFQIHATVTTKGTGTSGLFVTAPATSLAGESSIFAVRETTTGKGGIAALGGGSLTVYVTASDGSDLIVSSGYSVLLSGSYPVA
jgi:hypothetical protein